MLTPGQRRALALVLFAVGGLVTLVAQLDFPLLLIPIAAAGLAAVLRRAQGEVLVGSPWRVILAVPVALIVGLLALVGVDVLYNVFFPPLRWAVVSWIAGGLLFAFLVATALRTEVTAEERSDRWIWGAALAFAFVFVPPAAVFVSDLVGKDAKTIQPPEALVSTLDVIVLRDDSAHPPRDLISRDGWRIRTWSGRLDGDRIIWGTKGQPPQDPSDHADRVALLFPDGAEETLPETAGRPAVTAPTPEAGQAQIDRWLRAAREASPGTPTYAFLATDDRDRLADWQHRLRRPADPFAPRGDALRVKDAGQDATTTDMALRFAIRTPSEGQDRLLALQHRPWLLFARGEPYATPLDVDEVLASKKVSQCRHGQGLSTLCDEVDEAADLRNDDGYLQFVPSEIAGLTDKSKIYANVTRAGHDGDGTIYVDYWWYLPDNPTGAVGGALCGVGFVVAGLTCLDHQSDWEGVTVVLDGNDPSGPPKAITYAKHKGTIRYRYDAARQLWSTDPVARHLDTRVRPAVFVAKGTHASYARVCAGSKCRENGAPGLDLKEDFTENRHDGGRPWSRNGDAACGAECVALLPTRDHGEKPALWNAYSGFWGSAYCFFGAICALDDPPRSPGSQDRYRKPWCFDHLVVLGATAGRYALHGKSCPPPERSSDRPAEDERLLALGDSYSSGQGAGQYEPGTTSAQNTCYRSDRAWPQVLARRLGVTALPSLACSGAVSRDVRTGRPPTAKGGDQPERQRAQVGAITGDPTIVTLTIGGNDVGFRNVLQDCVIGDCVKKYNKPSGDVLAARVRDLRPDLVATYRAIQAKAPHARLIVMGYPRLFPVDAGTAHPVGNCAAGREISAPEATYLNGLLARLDDTIASAASDVGAIYADVREAFDGHELRCEGTSDLNRLRVGVSGELLAASFHPNANGYQRLAEVVHAGLPAS